MYDREQKKWVVSEQSANKMYIADEQTIQSEALREQFEEAERALAEVQRGEKNVDAVYLMEKTAKEGHPYACLAMAQMFEYGWAVSKSTKQALYWYKKAAEAGCEEASEILAKYKSSRRNRIITAVIAVVLCAALGVSAIIYFGSLIRKKDDDSKLVIKHSADSELIEPENMADFGDRLGELYNKYDNEDIINNKRFADRIVLIYTGDTLDLSDFDIAEILSNGEDYVVLQFDSADEAKRCLKYLISLEDTVSASFDRYSYSNSDSDAQAAAQSSGFSPVYHSSYTGCDYYTYGAEMMGFDQYSSFLQESLPADHHLTVGVIDTGIEPQGNTKDRIVPGAGVNGMDGLYDHVGHGTHVSGIILDCTQGLNIDVMPIGVSPLFWEEDGESVYNERGFMPDSSIIWGIEYAIEQKVEVINMSLGGRKLDSRTAEELLIMYDYDIDAILYAEYEEKQEIYTVNKAIDSGIIVVVSAGNDALDAEMYIPASIDGCITVSAIDSDKNACIRWKDDPKAETGTNFGDVIDVCAPGEHVLSYFPQPYGMKKKSGTSMASPHVAAMAAMMQLEFNESPEVISFYMKSYVEQLGYDKKYEGAGLPNGRLLLE